MIFKLLIVPVCLILPSTCISQNAVNNQKTNQVAIPFISPSMLKWTEMVEKQERPQLLLDTARLRFNMHTWTKPVDWKLWAYGTQDVKIKKDELGFTIILDANQTVKLSLPANTYPGPMAAIEIEVDAQDPNSGVLSWGTALFGKDGSYCAALVSSNNTAAIGVAKAGAPGTDISRTVTYGYHHFTTPGTALTGVFTGSVASLFFRPPGGTDTFIPGCSAATRSLTDPDATDVNPTGGYPDQRIPSAKLTLGLVIHSTVKGASLRIRRIRTGNFGEGSRREMIVVRRISDGAPVTDGKGKYLMTCTAQGPSISGKNNNLTWWGSCWYDVNTEMFGPVMRRFYSVRQAPWQKEGQSMLCTDSDGCVLYDDRIQSETYGQYHIYLCTTGTDNQFRGNDPIYNTYKVAYQPICDDIGKFGPDITLSKLSYCTFPEGVIAPYDIKIAPINGELYVVGNCSQGGSGATIQPTSWFIAKGSNFINFPVTIKPPLPQTTSQEWDGVGLAHIGGIWYATLVYPEKTIAASMTDGQVEGAMQFGGPFRLFVPHANIFEHQYLQNGKPKTEYHRLTHDIIYSSWGTDFLSYSPNTWMFGSVLKFKTEPVDGWEFPIDWPLKK